MSYAQIKPEYYRMFQPDSPWHAGMPGWKSAPWPGWMENPNLVGPQRLAVEGLGAYFAPKYETPIAGLGAYFAPKYERPISGLGKSGCGCGGSVGADATAATSSNPNIKGALFIGGAVLFLVGLAVVPNIWDG